MGVVVTGIMNGITRQEVQYSPSIGGPEFGPFAAREGNVHLQHVEEPNPLRIHELTIKPVSYSKSWHWPDARPFRLRVEPEKSLKAPQRFVGCKGFLRSWNWPRK